MDTTKLKYTPHHLRQLKIPLFLLLVLCNLSVVIAQTSSQTGIASVNGTELYYEIAGDGHPLILIHGGAVDNRAWDDQFIVFAQHHRVVRYDLRGAGKSGNRDKPFSRINDIVDAFQLGGQKFSGHRIRMFDHLYFSAIGGEDLDILLRNLGIDEATKVQAMVGANLRQPDAGIARAAFYDEGVGIYLAGLHRPFNDGDTGTILGTATWIQTFQLREAVEM